MGPGSPKPTFGPGPARLSGIQGLRGIAATAVVLCHVARHVDRAFGAQADVWAGAPALTTAFGAGHAGVDLFFPISGFIILFVHASDIGRPDRLTYYLRRRFNRVLPPYWLALALTVAMANASAHGWPGSQAGLWSGSIELLWAAALLPTTHEPLLGVAWTLQYEVVFYAAFAVLIVSRRAGVAVLAAWLAWITAAPFFGFGLFGGGVPPALCGIYGVEFFMGMGAAALVRRDLVPAPRLAAWAGAALFLAAMALESADILDGLGIAARFAYGLPAALLIAGVSAAERRGLASAPPRWLLSLGEASYSIYLFQFVFIGLAWQAWLRVGVNRTAPNLVCFVALAAAALAGGFLMSRLAEKPLLRIGRRRPTEPRTA